jgi:hypothetical protein
MQRFLSFFASILALVLALPAGAETIRSYHIGNSLTNIPLRGMLPEMSLEARAATVGDVSDVGWHILCGESLGSIWANPTATCVPPNGYGYFTPALANNTWDAVTFQPYSDPQAEARTTINNMAGVLRSNPSNAKTRLFVYEAWPQYLGATDYSAQWNAPYPGGVDNFHRDYFSKLTTDLRGDLGPDVYLIPIGEVLYRIDQLAKAGQVPGLSSVKQWYIDPAHLNGYGDLTATATLYATLYKKDPSAMPLPAEADPRIMAIINREVWSAVNADPLTGVGVPEPGAAVAIGFVAFVAGLMRRARR